MADIRVDHEGIFRCWNCGNKSLRKERRLRPRLVGLGVGAPTPRGAMRCLTCGEHNDTAHALPFSGPSDPTWRRDYDRQEADKSEAVRSTELRSAELAAQAFNAAPRPDRPT